MKRKRQLKNKQPAREHMLRIFREHAEFKKPIAVLIAINLVATVFAALGPLFIARITDTVVAHESWNQVLAYLGAYLATMLLSVHMAHMRWNHETRKLDWQQHNALVRKTLRHLVTLSIGQLRNQHSIVTASKVGSGQNAVRQLFDGLVYQMVPTLLMALVACIAMGIMYPVLGLTTFVLCIGMVWWTLRVAWLTYSPLKRQKMFEHTRVNKLNGDFVRNMPSALLARHEEPILEHIDRVRGVATRNHRMIHIPMGNLLAWMWGFNLSGRVLITGLAAWFIWNGAYQIGALAAVTAWVMQSLGRLQDLQQMVRSMLQAWIDSEIYFEIRDTMPAIETPAHAVQLDFVNGDIRFNNVTFTYDGAEQPALNDVSFSITSGMTVGIVGPSGAGKSTLLALLQGAFYSSGFGSITIDGFDMRNLDLARYREQVGFMEQETVLFDWSLLENLLFGVPKARRDFLRDHLDEVRSVLDKVGLAKLKHRLHERAGEAGRNLSGGERQRIAIARLALKKPDMLVVDEGTSSVDTSTERKVHELLQQVSPGSTRIFVAHRLSTVQDADLILVMDQGCLIASGTHAELLSACGLYAELVRDQLLNV